MPVLRRPDPVRKHPSWAAGGSGISSNGSITAPSNLFAGLPDTGSVESVIVTGTFFGTPANFSFGIAASSGSGFGEPGEPELALSKNRDPNSTVTIDNLNLPTPVVPPIVLSDGTNSNGIAQAFGIFGIFIDGQEIFVTGVLSTQGSNATAAIEGVGTVFKGFGGITVVGEQGFIGFSQIENGAPVGTTLTGVAVNSGLIFGSGVVVGDTVTGFFAGSEVPGVGNVVGAFAGAAVGFGAGKLFDNPEATGGFVVQPFQRSVELEFLSGGVPPLGN